MERVLPDMHRPEALPASLCDATYDRWDSHRIVLDGVESDEAMITDEEPFAGAVICHGEELTELEALRLEEVGDPTVMKMPEAVIDAYRTAITAGDTAHQRFLTLWQVYRELGEACESLLTRLDDAGEVAFLPGHDPALLDEQYRQAIIDTEHQLDGPSITELPEVLDRSENMLQGLVSQKAGVPAAACFDDLRELVLMHEWSTQVEDLADRITALRSAWRDYDVLYARWHTAHESADQSFCNGR